MTHDELLAKIDSELVNHGQRGNIVKHSFALRAVVELHRLEAQEHGQYEKCWNCNLIYPCPTIQVIEKELR
jgi:hypothetical protein